MTDVSTPLNELPVIIDTPGDYATHDGLRVTIRQVSDATPGTTSFGAVGAVWRERRGVTRARGHEIWHISGRNMVLRESPLDVVRRYEKI